MTGQASHDGGGPERGAGSRTLRGFPILQPYVPGRGAPGASMAARADSSITVDPTALPAEPCAIADLCERVACAGDAKEAARLALAELPGMLGVERAAIMLDAPRLALESVPPLRGTLGTGRFGGRARITRPLWLLSSPSTRLIHSAEAVVTASGERYGSIRIERAAQRFDAEEQGSLRIIAIALGQRLATLSALDAGVSHSSLPATQDVPRTPAYAGTLHRTPLHLSGESRAPEGGVDAEDERVGEERTRWDVFLASIAHEVRTPLTSISGYAQLMQRAARAARGPDGALKRGAAARVLATMERHLPPLERQVARIERLIRDALDLGEAEAGTLALELADCDAVELARRAVAGATAAGAGAYAPRLEAPAKLALRCDAARVERALGRMIEHVAHAQGDTGALTIRVRTVTHDGVRHASFEITGERTGADGAARTATAADDASERALPRDLGLAFSGMVARLHGGKLRRAGGGGGGAKLALPTTGPRAQQIREDDNDATDRRGG